MEWIYLLSWQTLKVLTRFCHEGKSKFNIGGAFTFHHLPSACKGFTWSLVNISTGSALSLSSSHRCVTTFNWEQSLFLDGADITRRHLVNWTEKLKRFLLRRSGVKSTSPATEMLEGWCLESDWKQSLYCHLGSVSAQYKDGIQFNFAIQQDLICAHGFLPLICIHIQHYRPSRRESHARTQKDIRHTDWRRENEYQVNDVMFRNEVFSSTLHFIFGGP